MQTIFTGLTGNDVLLGCKTKLIDDVFGLSCKTVRRRMKQGENHRLLIKTDDEKAFCFDIKEKRKLKITEDMRIKIGQ